MSTPTTGQIVPLGRSGAEVAPFDAAQTQFPVLFESGESGGFAELVRDNFGEDGFSISDLERYHVQPGGNTRWGSEEEDADAVEGVVVFWGITRSFWEQGLDDAEDTSPPDCASPDGREGIGKFGPGSPGNPSGACAECPMNAWGSGKGDSKACKEQRQLWILRPGEILPVQVSLPPTSIGPFKKYMTRLTTRGVRYYAVMTRLELEARKMGPNKVAVVKPSTVGELHPAEAAAAGSYGATIQGYLRDRIRASVEGDVATGQSAAAGAERNDPNDPWAEEDAGLGDVPADLQD